MATSKHEQLTPAHINNHSERDTQTIVDPVNLARADKRLGDVSDVPASGSWGCGGGYVWEVYASVALVFVWVSDWVCVWRFRCRGRCRRGAMCTGLGLCTCAV